MTRSTQVAVVTFASVTAIIVPVVLSTVLFQRPPSPTHSPRETSQAADEPAAVATTASADRQLIAGAPARTTPAAEARRAAGGSSVATTEQTARDFTLAKAVQPLERYGRRFAAEPRDAERSRLMQARVSELLAQHLVEPLHLNVECRQTLCKASLTFANQTDQAALGRIPPDGVQDLLIGAVELRGSNVHQEFYFSRLGPPENGGS